MVAPHLLGLRATAIVGVVVQPARLEATAQEITSFEEASYLVMTSGTFDLLIGVLCKDTDHFDHVLSEKLLQVEGVQRSARLWRWTTSYPPFVMGSSSHCWVPRGVIRPRPCASCRF